MRKAVFIFCLNLTIVISTITCQAQEEFCCKRSVMFAPVEMPAEQEYNSTGWLECAFYEGINIWSNRYECPIELTVIDADARMSLEKMISKLSDLAGSPPNPDHEKAIDSYQDLDYVFFCELHLDAVDEIDPGEWEEGYEGQPNYIQGQARGNYSLNIRLVNVHFDEKVWEGYTIWNGNAMGYTEWLPEPTTPNAVEDLGATMSPKIDKLIYDYERTPMNCTIEMEQEEVSTGEEIDIVLTNLTDEKGRQSRHWQRLVISLEQGEITNATKYGGEEKHWVVLVGEDDQVTLKYKAPRLCQKEKETIKIFNSCVWGGPTKPLEDTEPKKQLATKTFDIVPSEPKDCSVNIDYKTEYPPYFKLDITDIINENDKPCPDNLLIAVKAEKGRLEGGQFISGWRIYSTSGGRITEKIKYTPPQCAVSHTDLLSFAAVCETKEGTLSISPVKFTKKITNPKCSDATFTLTSRHLVEKKLDKEETVGNDYVKRKNDYRYDRKGTVTIQLKKHSVLDLPSIGNRNVLPETWVCYMSESRSFDSWDITYFEHRNEEKTSRSGGYRQKINEEAQISDVRLISPIPEAPIMVIVAYDKNTKKAKRVMVQASFVLGYTMNILRTTESESWLQGDKTSSSNSESKTKNERYSFEITGNPVMDPALGKEFPYGCLVSGGDGKSSFSGTGRKEETASGNGGGDYEEIYDLKTSDWVLMVNEK